MVERGVGGEARSVVDLEDDWLCLVVEHYVEAEQLEAHVGGVVFGLAGAVGVGQVRQPRDHGLNDAVLDFLLEPGHVHALSLQQLVHGSQRPLVPLRHVLFRLIEDELRVVLVDGVIGEVHAGLLHVLTVRGLVFLCREPAQPLFVEIEDQRVHAGDQDVDPEVELEAVDEVGPVEVALHHAVSSRVDVLQLPSQENSLPLREALRLHNEGPRLSLGLALKVSLQLVVLHRQHPGQREEIELFWKFLAHPHESPAEQIFPSEVVHARKMVNLLVEFHFSKGFRLHCIISPADIPIGGIGGGLFLPSEVLGHLAHHHILTIYGAQQVPEMLMTVLPFGLGFLRALRLGEGATSSESDYSESDCLEMFIFRS